MSQASIGAALSLTELQSDRFDDAEQRLSINQSDKARGFLRARAKFQVALVLHAYDSPHISHTPHVFITQRAVNISFPPLPRLYTSHYLTRCFLQESLPAFYAQAPSGAHQARSQRAKKFRAPVTPSSLTLQRRIRAASVQLLRTSRFQLPVVYNSFCSLCHQGLDFFWMHVSTQGGWIAGCSS